MSETTSTYQPGDELDINGTTIILATRKGNKGIRWTWYAPSLDLDCEGYHPTADDAIADARTKLPTTTCTHGQRGWCPTCHDTVEN